MVAAGLGAESIRGEYEQIFLFFTRKACEMLIGAQLYQDPNAHVHSESSEITHIS